jgi:hypothetical protein
MRRELFLICLLATAAGCGPRSPAKPVVLRPKIRIEPMSLDLGRLPAGNDSYHQARTLITDRGTADLHVIGLIPSCQCTLVKAPTRPIAPGQSAIIQVAVKVGIEAGERSSSVRVLSDDPAQPTSRFVVRWHAHSPLSAAPSAVEFGTIRPGTSVESQVAVSAIPTIAPGDVAIRHAGQELSCRWGVPPSLHAGVGVEGTLIVRVSPDGEQGDHLDSIALDAGPDVHVKIPVRWRVASGVRSSPAAIFSGKVAPGRPLESTLLLASEMQDDFRVIGASVGDERLSLDAKAAQAGRHHAIKVRTSAPDVAGPQRVLITIATDRPHSPKIIVPWSFIVTDGE